MPLSWPQLATRRVQPSSNYPAHDVVALALLLIDLLLGARIRDLSPEKLLVVDAMPPRRAEIQKLVLRLVAMRWGAPRRLVAARVTSVVARIKGRIGVLQPGAFGDIVLSDVDPIDDIAAFAQHQTASPT